MRTPLALLASLLALAAFAGSADAAGGPLAFDGGTPRQQAQVRAALAASTFPWSRLPQIVVHVGPGTGSYARPGEVWLDADLLDAGRFAWGTVQHEFAHQVDFLLLDDAQRARLQSLLGGTAWCHELEGTPHDAFGCERLADGVAAAYWVSPDNTARSVVPAAQLRAALDGMLGTRRLLASRVRR